MHIRGLKGSTRLTGAGSKVISLCAHVGLAQSRDHTHRWAWAGKQSKGWGDTGGGEAGACSSLSQWSPTQIHSAQGPSSVQPRAF